MTTFGPDDMWRTFRSQHDPASQDWFDRGAGLLLQAAELTALRALLPFTSMSRLGFARSRPAHQSLLPGHIEWLPNDTYVVRAGAVYDEATSAVLTTASPEEAIARLVELLAV